MWEGGSQEMVSGQVTNNTNNIVVFEVWVLLANGKWKSHDGQIRPRGKSDGFEVLYANKTAQYKIWAYYYYPDHNCNLLFPNPNK